MVGRTAQGDGNKGLTAMRWMGPLLVAMGLAATSLAAPATAGAEEAADSKAKEAPAKTETAETKAKDAPEADDKADSKAKDATANDKAEPKADSKAKEATRDLSEDKDNKDDAEELKDDEDDKSKTEKKKGGPDQGVEEPEAKLPARVPWRGTSLSWSNGFQPSMIGLGDDYQSDAFQAYRMTFGALINYFVVDHQGDFRLMINTAPSIVTELTNSGATNTIREPQFTDLPVTATGQIPIFQGKELPWWTSVNVRARAFLPTSPASQSDGTYMTTQLGAVYIQGLPLAYEAEKFQSIFLIGSFNYFRRFSRFSEPFLGDPDLGGRNPRRGALNVPAGAGVPQALSDTINGIAPGAPRFRRDRFSQAAILFLGEELGGINFQFFSAFSFVQEWLDPFEDENVCDATGMCRPLDESTAQGDADVLFNYGFSIGLSIFPWPEWGINLGYSNQTNTLATDGQRSNIFYEPTTATMSFGMSFSPDALYERLTGPRRARPFIVF